MTDAIDIDPVPERAVPMEVQPASDSPLAHLLADPDRLRDFPVETIERLAALHERFEADASRKEFAKAMNRVQTRMTPVIRTSRNQQTASMYAKVEAVQRMLSPLLAEEGFSTSFSTAESPVEDHMRVQMMLRHTGGHVETHHLDAPVDDRGIKGSANKTRLHGMGSTLSYCTRYLLCSVFGVELADDDDGRGGKAGPGATPITQQQADDLHALIEDVGADAKRFLAFFSVARIEDLPASRHREAVRMLDAKR